MIDGEQTGGDPAVDAVALRCEVDRLKAQLEDLSESVVVSVKRFKMEPGSGKVGFALDFHETADLHIGALVLCQAIVDTPEFRLPVRDAARSLIEQLLTTTGDDEGLRPCADPRAGKRS